MLLLLMKEIIETLHSVFFRVDKTDGNFPADFRLSESDAPRSPLQGDAQIRSVECQRKGSSCEIVVIFIVDTNKDVAKVEAIRCSIVNRKKSGEHFLGESSAFRT